MGRDDLARRDRASGRDQPLIKHLGDVAKRCRDFAEAMMPGDAESAALAEWAGWLHDLGKYRPEFQQYLRGNKPGSLETQHAVFGAGWVAANRLPYGLRLAIFGHHAGLHDYSKAKIRWADPALDPIGVSEQLMARLKEDRGADAESWPEQVAEFVSHSRRGPIKAEMHEELRIRMLFSCLVDADRLDAEAFDAEEERDPNPLHADLLFRRLDEHVNGLGEDRDSPVNVARREVYRACIDGAAKPRGCFSLTAPTGSGKTLAAMAFALKHAIHHEGAKNGPRRIIVVLPFLTIIEQNVGAYRKALCRQGDPVDVILEHHSAVLGLDDDPGEDLKEDDPRRVVLTEEQLSRRAKARQATENWDAPIVVTTAVQFLESLFSRSPSRARKLHNIARSVVIFDEVQTLPFTLLDPILSAVRDLRNQYGVTFLFGSATQPAFAKTDNLPHGFIPGECVPLIEEPQRVFATLRRARLELPCLKGEKWSWGDVAEKLKDEPQALIVVNLRHHAQDLFNHLRSRNSEGLFHLSTTMCTAHREAVLGKKDAPAPGTIHHALQNKKRCVVVSTQLIEAGVDVDFPVVFRALSPLDAIIQAAGRCDREGKLTLKAGSAAGRVVVFEPAAEPYLPRGFYEEATGHALRWLNAHKDAPDLILSEPALFEKYHQILIRTGIGRELAGKIQKSRESLEFEKVAESFKVIDSTGRGVVVPYDEDAKNLVDAIRHKGFITYQDRRRLQRHLVNLFPNWIAKLSKDLQAVLPNQAAEDRDDAPPLLEFIGIYHQSLGLPLGELPPETFII